MFMGDADESLRRLLSIVWAALVLQIPFELKYTWAGLSNLQWTFVALALLHIPAVYRNRQKLKKDRMIQAAGLLISIQWASAFFASEFNVNAWKGAARFTIGLALMAMARISVDRNAVLRIWARAAAFAALYALVAHEGFGFPWLFRDGEFFIAQVQRLSGSFEYPNIAAAYFAMSLPIIWWTPSWPAFRWGGAVFLWCALILTFSRGAVAAVAIVVLLKWMFSLKRPVEWRMAAGLILAGVVATGLSAVFSPYLAEVTKRAPENPPAAQYATPWNRLLEQPGAGDSVQLNVRNTGSIPWLAKGSERVAVGYKWRNRESQRVETGSEVTVFPHDIQPGEAIELSVPFRTPEKPGKYLLIMELFVRRFDWFSNAGVTPAVMEADIQPGISRLAESLKSADRRPTQHDPRTAPEPVPRSQLWRAAIDMFRAHPFGVGPDNYRVMYGRFLGYSNWNTKTYSNNLYLELLTGSGILGVAAFGLMLFSIPRSGATSVLMAIAVFLVHGLVDVFLMTTPIYFSFWILLGICGESQAVER
jgi:hypothetical protein